MKGKIHLNLLKSKKNQSLKELNDNIHKTIYVKKKKAIPIASGYFPEDFSLNIFKSTSLYKRRYQIESLPLKKQLKLINLQKKSNKNEKIIKAIKKNIIENNFSSDLMRLLKSNKIDRFAKRYLEKENNTKKKENNMKTMKFRRILTSKSNKFEENKQLDEDKMNNNDLILQKILIPFNSIQIDKTKNIYEENIISLDSDNKINNNMINSASQTCNINEYEKYKENKDIERPIPHSILKNDYLCDSITSYNNSKKNIEKYNIRRFKKLKFSKKYLFLDKNNNVKIFSPTKSKFNLNNNIINKSKLVFSFYDPNDEHIKLMKEFEKKLKLLSSNEKYADFSANFNQ